MKQKKNKIVIAWILLFGLIGIALSITFMKFFPKNNNNIEERPVNESSSNAIHTALQDITVNFNQNPNVVKFAEDNNIILKAALNNYSIYISYIAETTTTYEFAYDNLCLNITINNNKVDKTKFNIIYQFLIEAVQKRINNTDDISSTINDFLNNDKNYEGLTKNELATGIEYQMNITKKIN